MLSLTLRALAALAMIAVALMSSVAAQPSIVEPGAELTLQVNERPLYPLGWNLVGHCPPPEDPLSTSRDSLVTEMERIRSHGSNAVFESSSGDGRYIPSRVTLNDWNWYGYTITDFDGNAVPWGHIRPGVYVAALRRYMDLAYFGEDGEARAPIYTIVSLDKYTVPKGTGSPYSGSDTLRCDEYKSFIEAERSRHEQAGSEFTSLIPPAVCNGEEVLPFWEWNIRYIVQNLRDHPGLLSWYLWDEPEGITSRHLFGITPPGTPPRPYTGPESLPTPDLLRYVYRRVIAFETQGRPATYRRHPVMVDLYDVEVFFSDRFSWSREGSMRPAFHSGPFDRTPDGGYETPADLLGIDVSTFWQETEARGNQPAHDWYWDPNIMSQRTEMLREAAERDSLWSAFVVAGQGWLASGGPYGVSEPLRCPINDRPRLALLNDRDLVWNLITPQINGMRGQLYYARSLNPYRGEGAEQVQRIDRMLGQFREARLDHIFSTPDLEEGWTVESLNIEALTNYFRSDPDFVGPADRYDPGRSVFSQQAQLSAPEFYRAGRFTRSSDSSGYGHTIERPGSSATHRAHRLLRTALHRHEDSLYLFVSNAYDARITATLRLSETLYGNRLLREGQFDLDAGGLFEWGPTSGRMFASRPNDGGVRLAIGLEPYEARIFRIGP